MRRWMAAILFFLAAGAAYAQEIDDPAREFNFRVSYTIDLSEPDFVSAENLSEISMFMTDIPTRLLDLGIYSVFDDASIRKVMFVFTGFLRYGLKEYDVAVSTWEHEEGHILQYRKAGIDREHVVFIHTSGRRTHIPHFWDTLDDVIGNNFGMNGAAVAIDNDGWTKLTTDPKKLSHIHEFLAAFEAGGLNQEQSSLRKRNERVLAGQAHILDFLPWFRYTIATLNYATDEPSSDIDDYLEQLKFLGVDSKASHIKNVQWLKFVGASAITMYAGAIDFLQDGDPIVEPLGFPLVEFASYLSVHGPTLAIGLVGSAISGLTMEPSFHFALDDAKHEEYGLRLRWTEGILTLAIAGFLNRAGGNWLEGNVAVSPLSWLEIGLGAEGGHGFTYEREVSGKSFFFLKVNEFRPEATLAFNLRF